MTVHNTPPGPRGLPIIGNTHQWARDPLRFRERCAEQYGTVTSYDILGMDAYMLTNPDTIERILVREADSFPKHPKSLDRLRDIVGNGLLTSEGELWERQREAIEPAFYMAQIKRYADIMVDQTTERIAGWNPNNSLDLYHEMTRLTLEILVKTMFGRDIDLTARGIHDAVDALNAPLKPRNQPITLLAPDWAPIPFLRRARNALDHLDAQIYDIINNRRQSDEGHDDLLSMLLDTDAAMSDKQIRDEMMTFLLAGHETTALSLTYIFDLLSRNSDVEARLHEELETTLNGNRPTIADLSNFEYTERIVKEAMRLYPPAHELRRKATETVTIDSYTIPAGAVLVLPTWVMHRDERFWNDPETFHPDRWDMITDQPEFVYFPFGSGSRRCIGQQFAMTETQLIMATIVQKFTFDRQYETLSLSGGVTLRPTNTVEMVSQFR
jgi:cytochrome P450